MAAPVPATIVTGFLATGKTTAIIDLFKKRPPEEKWAVLVNEFGEVGVDGALLQGRGNGIYIKEVAGGCLCCTGQVALRVALTRLLREVRPHRLLIEPSGLGHPAGVFDALQDEWLSKALTVESVICLVDPRQLDDPRILNAPAFRDQVGLADILVANKTDLATQEQLSAFFAFSATLYPPKRHIAQTRYGQLDLAWLSRGGDKGVAALAPRGGRHSTQRITASVLLPPSFTEASRWEGRDGATATAGWLFPPHVRFRRAQVEALLSRVAREDFPGLTGLIRLKAVLRIDREWVAVNWARGDIAMTPVAYRRDSRLELVVQAPLPRWAAFEAALLETAGR